MRCLRLVRCVRGQWPPLVHEVAAESVVEQTVSVVSEEVAHSGGALIGVVCPPSLYVQTAQAVARAHADRTGTAQTALENQVLVLDSGGRRRAWSLMLW